VHDLPYRISLLVILAGAVGASGYLRDRARRAGASIPRRAEGGALIALRVAITLPLLLALLAYLVAPAWIAFASLGLPPWLRWSGAALAVGGAALAITALLHLGPNVSETVLTRPGQQLIQSGPYRLVRHPLYAGGSLMLIGAGVLSSSALVAGLALLAIAAVRIVLVPREERALVEQFGPAYLDYRRRSGALLPRAGPASGPAETHARRSGAAGRDV
jgi:protein-S-isoprenylcysteine O-methyltransferase